MIPQLINELFEAKESPAARELAIAYLRNQKDENIMFLLVVITNPTSLRKNCITFIKKLKTHDLLVMILQ